MVQQRKAGNWPFEEQLAGNQRMLLGRRQHAAPGCGGLYGTENDLVFPAHYFLFLFLSFTMPSCSSSLLVALLQRHFDRG
jgi:hypothetical protein